MSVAEVAIVAVLTVLGLLSAYGLFFAGLEMSLRLYRRWRATR